MPKLYKISQEVNNDYDTYDSAIVVAETKEEASQIHPQEYLNDLEGNETWWEARLIRSWAYPEDVTVVEIGIFVSNPNSDKESRVICASFNAG